MAREDASQLRLLLRDYQVRQAWVDALSVYRQRTTKDIISSQTEQQLFHHQGKLAMLDILTNFPSTLDAELDRARESKSWLIR